MMSLSGEGQARSRLSMRRVGVMFVLACASVFAVLLFGARSALADPPALTPSPATLDFGTQDMHNQSTLPVTFMNNSANPTTVSGPATIAGSASFSISQDSCSGQIPVGGSCSVNVTFYALPTGPGQKSATLTLTDDTGTNTVQVSGTAITGTLTSDQSSLDFGGIVINQGNSNQQHVTISDDLSAGVNISNIQIIGADAPSFYVQNNGCPSTLQPGNTCQIYVQFQPNSAGPQKAQLQINNDGTKNPLLVSLTGEGLTGPAVSVTPPQAIYGNVALGSEALQTFTLTNDGDAPLQVGAMFLAAGSPQVFPISGNNCTDRQIAPGDSCQVTVGFVPIATGDKDGSLFVITNASNPGVTTIGLDGIGVTPAGAPPPAPDGKVRISGAAQAGKRLTCSTHSYPSGTRFSYRWLRNGKPIPGARAKRRALGDADVGARIACRVTATSPGGSQTVTSRPTAPTLAQLRIDTIGSHGAMITAAVTISRGSLHATGLILNPQALHGASFGSETVTVRAGGTYTINLSADPAATRALRAGRALHVKETLTLDATHARKPIHRSFSINVK
jgi:Cep192 domain 4